MFAAKGNVGTLPSNPAQPQDNKRLTLNQLEQIPLSNTSKPIKIRTSYRALINTQNEAQLVPSQELTDIVVKEIPPQIPQASCQLLITSDKPPATSDEPRAANHPALAQLLQAAELAGKGQNTSQVLVQSDVTQETILPENNLPKSDTSQGQVGQQLLSPEALVKISNYGSLLAEGEAAPVIQTADKTPVIETKHPNLSLLKELMLQAANTNKIGEKVTAPNEKPDAADKPSALSNEKIFISENSISNIEQNASTELKKPLFNTEKPLLAQHGHTSQNGFAESANGSKEQGADLSDLLPGQKPSQTQVKVSIEQITDQSSSSSNNGSQPNFEQMLVADNAQAAVKEQLSAAAQTAKNAQSLPNTSVSEQIQGSILGSLRQGDQQITIRLNPPELGKVTIKFHEQENQLTGLLQVSKTQTKYEIQQALPEIIQNLQNMGIQVKKLEVVMSEPDLTGQQAYNNQSLQDGSAGHQAGTHENTPSGTVTANEWLTKNSGYSQTPQSQQGTQITDKSINMLM
ncbi:MAG: flagellar hook-length control protein FliK [Planctomycetota bacterium]|nr:flagellar hook-length control protein FliK [Planctomycetota bacterium]